MTDVRPGQIRVRRVHDGIAMRSCVYLVVGMQQPCNELCVMFIVHVISNQRRSNTFFPGARALMLAAVAAGDEMICDV